MEIEEPEVARTLPRRRPILTARHQGQPSAVFADLHSAGRWCPPQPPTGGSSPASALPHEGTVRAQVAEDSCRA